MIELGEQQTRSTKQEEAWSTASIDGRAHFSEREFARRNREGFRSMIIDFQVARILTVGLSDYRSVMFKLSEELLAYILDIITPTLGNLVFLFVSRSKRVLEKENQHLPLPFRICARKRPFMPFELEQFDSISITQPCSLFVHAGRLARSGKRLKMKHSRFSYDRVWGGEASNRDVYVDEMLNIVQRAKEGKSGTLLLYGQTGTGKTHTLVGVIKELARDLVGQSVEVQFFELYGKKCFDLLKNRGEIKLLSDESGAVHARGAAKIKILCSDAAAFEAVVGAGLSLRKVEATERNPISSRSHAVCRVTLFSPDDESSARITLVDLAGSERNYETTSMTPAQHKESALINTSLMTLKDCFRAYFENHRIIDFEPNSSSVPVATRVPYRGDNLTRTLQECFTDSAHRTVILTTVSPSAQDVQHTFNSLAHVVLMSPLLAEDRGHIDVEIPLFKEKELPTTAVNEWTSEQVNAWMATVEGGRFAQLTLPPSINGLALLRLSVFRMSELFEGIIRESRESQEGQAWVLSANEKSSVGKTVFRALRNEQINFAKREAQKLRSSELGNNKAQRH